MDKIIRILCIDDEVNVLRALKRLFLDDDYVIFTASTTDMASEIFRTASPIHVVICDYLMPGTDGIKLLTEVSKTWPDTIRILLSGCLDTLSAPDDLVYRFVSKPWDDTELRKCVQGAVGLSLERMERRYAAERSETSPPSPSCSHCHHGL